MYKYLLSMSFFSLSAQVIAGNATNIKAAEVTSPVHVGIFRGFCGNLNLTNLKAPADFASLSTKACQYMMDQTLDPKKPNAVLKAWHQGAGTLTAVAFQDNGAPVQCIIDDAYKTMFIVGGPNGLKCSSPEVQADANEEEPKAPAPQPVVAVNEDPQSPIPQPMAAVNTDALVMDEDSIEE